MNAVVITRNNPNVNFGQTVLILTQTKTNAVIRPDGTDAKYTVDIRDIWPFSKMYEYEELNIAMDISKGWTWQN